MYRRAGILILVVLSIFRIAPARSAGGEADPDDIYCQQCLSLNRGCVRGSGCTPTCSSKYHDDGEGNCVEDEEPRQVDYTGDDESIDRIALQAHSGHASRDAQDNAQGDYHEVNAVDNTDDRWVKPILKNTYGSDVHIETVLHDGDASISDKVASVLSAATDIPPSIHAVLPPRPAALQADESRAASNPLHQAASMADVYFLMIVAGCSVFGLVGLVVAGVCWYRLQKNVKAAAEAEYPAYGVTGPAKERVESPGDRKLAQSAQMYHYQHQKQQMLALEKANDNMKPDASDEDTEEENEEGDYTVYECPGLAPTGEMEVKNPLFEETPVTPTPGGATSQDAPVTDDK